MAIFYNLDRSRTCKNAQYPPVFMFHIGGRFGDHSSMDFWPARREIFLDAEPPEVLGGITDRAITRLIVPDVAPGSLDYVSRQPSGWTNLHAAGEQITACYAYSTTGSATIADVELIGNDARMETMVEDVLQPDRLAEEFRQRNDPDLLELPSARRRPTTSAAGSGSFYEGQTKFPQPSKTGSSTIAESPFPTIRSRRRTAPLPSTRRFNP